MEVRIHTKSSSGAHAWITSGTRSSLDELLDLRRQSVSVTQVEIAREREGEWSGESDEAGGR